MFIDREHPPQTNNGKKDQGDCYGVLFFQGYGTSLNTIVLIRVLLGDPEIKFFFQMKRKIPEPKNLTSVKRVDAWCAVICLFSCRKEMFLPLIRFKAMTRKKKERIFNITLWLSILFYTASLFFTGYSVPNTSEENYGFLLVLFGWAEVFSDGAGYVWLANPLLWYSWWWRKHLQKSLWSSLLSALVALMFLFSSSIMPSGPCGSWLEQSNCDPVPIVSVNSGYYLWLLCPLILTVGNFYRMEFCVRR